MGATVQIQYRTIHVINRLDNLSSRSSRYIAPSFGSVSSVAGGGGGGMYGISPPRDHEVPLPLLLVLLVVLLLYTIIAQL